MHTQMNLSIFIFIITFVSTFLHDIMFNKKDVRKIDVKKVLFEKLLLSTFISTCTYMAYPLISNEKLSNQSELHTESFDS